MEGTARWTSWNLCPDLSMPGWQCFTGATHALKTTPLAPGTATSCRRCGRFRRPDPRQPGRKGLPIPGPAPASAEPVAAWSERIQSQTRRTPIAAPSPPPLPGVGTSSGPAECSLGYRHRPGIRQSDGSRSAPTSRCRDAARQPLHRVAGRVAVIDSLCPVRRRHSPNLSSDLGHRVSLKSERKLSYFTELKWTGVAHCQPRSTKDPRSSLIGMSSSAGNAIHKACLSHKSTRQIAPGTYCILAGHTTVVGSLF